MSVDFLRPTALVGLALIPLALLVATRSGRLADRRRRWSMVVRAVLLALLVVGLARPRLVRGVDHTSVAYLLDASDSVPGAERQRGETLARDAIERAPDGDVSAVVVFGSGPVVERTAREGELESIQSIPDTGRTDIGAALRLGLALLPSRTGRRMVLVSDGRDNIGSFDREADILVAAGIPVDVVPLGASLGAGEVVLQRLEAPTSGRVGQRVSLKAVVTADKPGAARLVILDEDKVVVEQDVVLVHGPNEFEAPVEFTEPGFRNFSAKIFPTNDSRAENNTASAFTLVSGPPKVLVVAQDAEQAGPLVSALQGADRTPVVVDPSAVPQTVIGLAQYDAVVLVNVPARTLPDGADAALAAFVRDLGHGLVMVGGDRSFGSGGYRDTAIERALPVDMEVRDRERRPKTAVAFVVDKSGSMAECPACSSGVSGYGGMTKVDLAKEAVAQAADVLDLETEVGVVAFDDRSHVVTALTTLGDSGDLGGAVAGITADGGTNIYSGMVEGTDQLEQSSATLRHIILLTDGWSDSTGYERVIDRMNDQGITMSIVAVGQDTAPYLAELAEQAGGRYYAVVDPADIPQIFVDETITTLGMYVIEEQFHPVPGVKSEVLAGIDAATVPALGGYNGTTAKQSARVGLWSHREDPVLAQWQYGLGRSVAWTSDMKRQWAQEWITWPGFTSFAVQAIDWTVPAPDSEGLTLEAEVRGGRVHLRLVDAESERTAASGLNVAARISGPDGEGVTVPLVQTGVNTFESDADLPAEGTYLVRVTARDESQVVGSQTAGLVVPYSPEYADPGDAPTDARLARLAEMTHGRVLDTPEGVYERVSGVRRADEVWMWLFLAAAFIYPLDIAARRLRLNRADLGAAGAWLRTRRRVAATAGAARKPAPVLGDLARARGKVRDTVAVRSGARSVTSAAPAAKHEPAADRASEADLPADATPDVPADAVAPEDTMARLKEAKRRAQANRR